jgi:hypothetical protein
MTNLWAEFALCFIPLFSVVNPFSAIPPFVGLTTDIPSPERNRITRQTGLAVFIILTVSYLAGEGLLRFFSIGVDSLRVAGGLLILAMAWSLVGGRVSQAKQTPEEAAEAEERQSLGLVPMAMHGVHVSALQVTRRRWRELAIRRAVGAGRGRVIAHVVGERVRVGLWGVAGMVFWGTMVVAFLQ